jgi:uncharacterized membrane protein YdbT with pleckstrin-like domain
LVSSSGHVAHGAVVWYGKPWVVPAAVVRTVSIVLAALLVLFLEMLFGVALIVVGGLTVYLWTLALFTFAWILSLLDLLFFWASHSYLLRQDGIEIRRGIIRLHSFVVTPSGFGDLMVYQSLGGRIFGYGEITVNSQGERQTKLRLVRSPFTTADTIRDIMGKPIVRVEDRA